MEPDFRSLKSFAELAADLSFTRAAARLGVTQPQLSMRIRNLEERLGFRLFERTSRRVQLTAQGARLLPQTLRLLDEAERLNALTDSIRYDIGAILRIGATDYCRSLRRRLLSQFMAMNAGVTVEVEVIRRPAEGFAGLANGRFDIAIMLQGERVPPEFETLSLLHAPVGLLLPAKTPLADKDDLTSSDLRNLPVALFRRDNSPALYDEMVRLLEPCGAKITRLPEPSEEGLAEFVRESGIAAICARWWAPEEDAPSGLKHRQIAGQSFVSRFIVAKRRDDGSKITKRFWSLARKEWIAPTPQSRTMSEIRSD